MSDKTVQRRMDALVATFRQNGLKLTHQRREIFREVAQSKEHPDAEHVYKAVRRRIPSVSLDTVYRALCLMERHKLFRRIAMVSGPSRFDADPQRHYHFVCDECGAVQDFRCKELDAVPVPKRARALGRVEDLRIQAHGLCRRCRRPRRKR